MLAGVLLLLLLPLLRAFFEMCGSGGQFAAAFLSVAVREDFPCALRACLKTVLRSFVPKVLVFGSFLLVLGWYVWCAVRGLEVLATDFVVLELGPVL